MSKLTLETDGETDVIVTRRFAAPPEAVFRAHTDPELLRQWLLGPDGWTMPVCINEARPGGRIRYEWSDGKGGGFHLTGEYVELAPPTRIVHVERMHLPARARMTGVPHTPGTREYLTCERGRMELTVAGTTFTLGEGDVVVFRGDQRHAYHNPGPGPAVAYSVIAFAR